ncbi:hypothetical protein C7212DRAFT_341219 [Tuber magnatum]|uniref:Uncharacterized protein n=1 Tax=Tuber magnatum TaxID=42249 RepID=A0A317T3Z5_9PEZI|nr:hypothetical protein C7212DRAFT_341219 [Tuber magnatum]
MSPSSSPRSNTPPCPLPLDVSEIELEISLLRKLVNFLKTEKEEHDAAAESVIASPTYYIHSLKNFNSLSSTLAFYLNLLLPDVSMAEKAKAEAGGWDEQWIEQAIIWASEILHILGEMQRCLATLRGIKPDDLRGNYHSLEEWEEEVVSAAETLEGAMARFKTEMNGKKNAARSGTLLVKVFAEVKGIRILNLK